MAPLLIMRVAEAERFGPDQTLIALGVLEEVVVEDGTTAQLMGLADLEVHREPTVLEEAVAQVTTVVFQNVVATEL
jgi:hypothetical protein